MKYALSTTSDRMHVATEQDMSEKRRRVQAKSTSTAACLACCFRRAQSMQKQTQAAGTQTALVDVSSEPDVIQERFVAFGVLEDESGEKDVWFQWEPLRRAFFAREMFPPSDDHVVIVLRDVEEVCATFPYSTEEMEQQSRWCSLLDILHRREPFDEDVTIDRVVSNANNTVRFQTQRTLLLRTRFEAHDHTPPRHHILDIVRFVR